ncbi:MAG: hypothetical protein V1684_02760 [bacterium]
MESIKQQFKKGKNGRLFILFILLIILLILLLSRCSCGQKQKPNNANTNANGNTNSNANSNSNTGSNTNSNTNTNTEQENLWPDLSDCMNGIITDYDSSLEVNNSTDAVKVFNEYVKWTQDNHKEVFSGKGNHWTAQSAKPHGIYQGVKYWRITALWADQGKIKPQIIFDVNANGQVVRFLGCL